MKKILSILAVLLCMAAIPKAYAYNFVSGGIYYDITSPNTVSVTYATGSYNSYSGTVDIPSTVTYNGITYTVTAIGNNAFRNCSNLTGVSIPGTVTSIGEYAFYYCGNLHAIDLPNTLTTIGTYAFFQCGLYSITIPVSVTTISDKAFHNCPISSVTFNADSCLYMGNSSTSSTFGNCQHLTIGTNVKHIPAYAFESCRLDTLVIPSSVISIGDYAFRRCNQMTYLHLSEGIVRIGIQSFAGCNSLDSVNIPSSVNLIENGAFASSNINSFTVDSGNVIFDNRDNCQAIIHSNTNKIVAGCKNSTIPASVTAIGDYAFYNCTGLTGSLTIPEQISYVGIRAFSYSGISSITIGSSVDSIGDNAFSGCTALSSVIYNADSCTYMGSDAYPQYYSVFLGCQALSSLFIGNNVKYIPNCAFYNCNNLSGMLIIPDNVSVIGDYAFYGCSVLSTLSLGNSVTTIGSRAFNGCSMLSSIIFGSSVTSIGNSAFSRCSMLSSITIPDHVRIIGEWAFKECINLNSLTIGTGVESIGDGAFDQCTALNEVFFNADSCYYMGSGYSNNTVFSDCSAFSSLIIGENVKYIPSNAFKSCTHLTGVLLIPDSIKTIGNHAFQYCTGLTSLHLGSSLSQIGEDAFSGCSGLTNALVIPDSVKDIGQFAFLGCSNFDSIVIGKSVSSIGNYAFQHCYNMSHVIFNADSCGELHNAFTNNSNIVSVTIGDNVKFIPNNAFQNCSGLTGTLVIPDSVIRIGAAAFAGCVGLDSLSLGHSINTICNEAFSGCSGLIKTLTLPNNTKTIGQGAFQNCIGLNGELTIPEHVISIGGDAFYNSKITSVHFNADYCSDLPYGAFGECDSLTSVTIGLNVKRIPARIFYECGSISEQIVIPDSVSIIGESAFNNCSSIGSLIIGKSVSSIGNSAFYNCMGLTGELIIPNSVTIISSGAFYNCGFSSVTIGSSVSSMGIRAFGSCPVLTSVKFNADSCKTMGLYNSYLNNYTGVFAGCSNLTTLTIGANVKSIPPGAFQGCSGVNIINSLATIPPTVQQIIDNTNPPSFYGISRNTPVYVPCGCAQAYRDTWTYLPAIGAVSYFNNIYETLVPYIFTVTSEDTLKGSVQITQQPTCSEPAVIEATSNFFYVFDHWSDGNTENPRTVELTQDTALVAYFREYTVEVMTNDTLRGTATVLIQPTLDNPQATIQAFLKDSCYMFAGWNDGNTENPRVVNITQDTILIATFNSVVNLQITSPSTICQGESTTLIATGADSYLWFNGDTSAVINIQPENSMEVSVTGTDNNGCSLTAMHLVSVIPIPSLTINGVTDICDGESTVLTAHISDQTEEVVFFEDFENGLNGWYKRDFDGDNYTWFSTLNSVLSAYEGNGAAASNSWNSSVGALNPNNLLFTSLHIPTTGGQLSWYAAAQDANYPYEHYEVYVYTNPYGHSFGTPTSIFSEWIPTPIFSETLSNGQWKYNTVSLNDWAGEDVLIGFAHNNCTDQYILKIDNIRIVTFLSGDTYLWNTGNTTNQLTTNETGVYYVTATNSYGCSVSDSVTVSVWQPDTVDISINSPDKFFVMNGETFCESGDYTQTLQNIHGCDSVVNLHLTIAPNITVVNDTVYGKHHYTTTNTNINIYGTRESYQYKMAPDKYAHWADSVLTDWLEWSEMDSTYIYLSYDSITNMASMNFEYVYVYRRFNGTVYRDEFFTLDNSYINSAFYDFSDTLILLSTVGCDSTIIWNTRIFFRDYVELHDLEECSFILQGDSLFITNPIYQETVVGGIGYGDTLTESGTYLQKLTNTNGCDSTVYLFLTIHPAIYEEITITACDSCILNGVTYMESGDYMQNTDTLLTTIRKMIYIDWRGWGYNDIYGNFVNFRPNGWSTMQWNYDEETGTGSYSYFDQYGIEHPYVMGDTIPYIDTVPGCKVTTLHLTINHFVTESAEVTACDSYSWNDSIYTQSGDYTQTFTAANGCDSVVTLHLTINYSNTGDTTVVACDSFEWHGETYTQSGDFPLTLTNAAGCDSIVTLHLTVNASDHTELTAVACGQYVWLDSTYTESGDYSVTYTNVMECDSIVTLHLTINPIPEVAITGNTTICPGGGTMLTATGADSYLWSNYSSSASIPVNMFGVYSVTGTTSAGCSNSASVTVLVAQPPVITITGNTDLCAGESATLTANGGMTYMWSNGSTDSVLTVTAAGSYQVIGYDENGCNSMASVNVNVWQPATSSLYITSFDSCYTWFGTPYCQSGDYIHTLQTIHGCDSVITLHLTLEEAFTTEFNATGCDSYTWNGITYSQSGNYTQNFTAANGNDSIVTLHLTITNTDHTDFTDVACESYTWNGETYTQSGNYTQTFTNSAGCDSVATLHLTITNTDHTDFTDVACESYTWNGETYTQSGTYSQTFTNSAGCDSIVTLHLTINQPTAGDTTAIACDSFTWYGSTYTSSGTYQSYQTNAAGCDSVVTLHLTINQPTAGDTTAVACDSFTWHGNTYTSSGTYQSYQTNAAGCDSVVTLHLTVMADFVPQVTVSGMLTACGNETATLSVPGNYHDYLWSTGDTTASITVGTAGYYWVTIGDGNGCTTVSEPVHLGVSESVSETPALCMVGVVGNHNMVIWEELTDPDVVGYQLYRENGQANVFEPLTFVPAGIVNSYEDTTADPSIRAYRYKITAVDTCGGETPMSEYHKTVHLTINQGLGNSYNLIWTPYEGFEFASYKLYRGTANNNLQLIQTMPSTLTSFTDNNPSGDALFYQIEVVMNGSCVQHTRDITFTGARSNIVYNGTPVTTDVSVSACDSYDWNGQHLTTSGDYTQSFTSLLGYDSVVTLHLTVNNSATSEFSITTSDSCYSWNNIDYCASGNYTQTLQTIHGCDSVVTLHLTITVGVDDYDSFDFKVYPNPTNGVVNVEYIMKNEEWGEVELHLCDAYGRLLDVVGANNYSPLQTALIDLSRYASGIYFVKAVANGKTIAMRKVVKQ